MAVSWLSRRVRDCLSRALHSLRPAACRVERGSVGCPDVASAGIKECQDCINRPGHRRFPLRTAVAGLPVRCRFDRSARQPGSAFPFVGNAIDANHSSSCSFRLSSFRRAVGRKAFVVSQTIQMHIVSSPRLSRLAWLLRSCRIHLTRTRRAISLLIPVARAVPASSPTRSHRSGTGRPVTPQAGYSRRHPVSVPVRAAIRAADWSATRVN